MTNEERRAALKLAESDLQEIDGAILSECSDRWLKIARIVGSAESRLKGSFPELSYIFYTERVIHLINRGVLEVSGNPNHIRFSEIRRTPLSIAEKEGGGC